jgi:CRP/FNR family transcriptional regulator, nitrogen oxide reductase regulator
MKQAHAHVGPARSPLLADLDPAALETVLAEAQVRRFLGSQVVCRAGETATHLFLVRKGRVRFSRLSTKGQEVVLGLLSPGDIFGLGSLIDVAQNYIGTAETLEASEIVVWTRGSIRRLSATYPVLSSNALQVAMRYVAIFAERHVRLVSSTAEQRLARTLLQLGARSGTATPTGMEVAIKNEHLASLSDISPYTASRFLRAWDRDGSVRKSRGKVHITSPERLLLD